MNFLEHKITVNDLILITNTVAIGVPKRICKHITRRFLLAISIL